MNGSSAVGVLSAKGHLGVNFPVALGNQDGLDADPPETTNRTRIPKTGKTGVGASSGVRNSCWTQWNKEEERSQCRPATRSSEPRAGFQLWSTCKKRGHGHLGPEGLQSSRTAMPTKVAGHSADDSR